MSVVLRGLTQRQRPRGRGLARSTGRRSAVGDPRAGVRSTSPTIGSRQLDAESRDAPSCLAVGYRTRSAVPLLRDGKAIGVALRRPDPRSGRSPTAQIALLETFADQAVIAIENARLFEELEQRNAELQESNRQVTEALEQQTATAEILRVIASSPTDLQPVLEPSSERALRICGARVARISTSGGDELVVDRRDCWIRAAASLGYRRTR